jgi:hypothetical protein
MVRSADGYSRYGAATWRWWCEQNGAVFMLLDSPLGGERFSVLPPTFQRWLAPDRLVESYGPDIEIAMVDADTMIRWDAPSPFAEAAGRFSAVVDGGPRWINRSITAFERFFPGVRAPWWEAFNCGVVIMSGRHPAMLRRFVEFSLARWPELSAVIETKDVGTDQPLLNLYLRSVGEAVHRLPRAFNLLHCVNLSAIDAIVAASSPEEHARIFSSPSLYDFVDLAYVWHFSNVVRDRETAMAETWARVSSNYRGATLG